MERFHRLLIVLTVCLLPWFGRPPCHAQSPAAPPAALPPAPAPARGEGVQSLPPGPARPRVEEQGPSTRPSLKSSLELPPPPDSQLEKSLTIPPLQAGDLRFPINLAVALRLADA